MAILLFILEIPTSVNAKPTISYKSGIVLVIHLDYINAAFLLTLLGCSGLSRTSKLSQKLSSVRKAAQ